MQLIQLILEDKKKRVIRGQEEIKFSSNSSFHLIAVTARARSEKQISKRETDDEELVVRIDGKTFPKLGSKEALLDSPAAFNGGQIHNLSKTVYFLTFLQGKNHTITLETDKPHNTATFEGLEVYILDLDKNLHLKIEKQAEDGDRRPWVSAALDNLPLSSVTIKTTYSRRKWDSDDVQIIIDGKIYQNIFRTIKHILWRFAGSLLPKILPTLTETETFTPNLSQGLHYIEFHADRMPVLHNLTLDFGETPQPPKRVPTVDNPKWTGSFDDDPEDILLARLIFGEAENQPKEAKIGVGFTVLNRVKKQQPNWGFTNREVILKEDQYDALWNKNTRDKVRDPLVNASEERRKEWATAYGVAQSVLAGTLTDPTSGATNFHSFSEEERFRFPSWATEQNFKIKLGDIYFYELEK